MLPSYHFLPLSGPGERVQVHVRAGIRRRPLWQRNRRVCQSALSKPGPVPRWPQWLPVPVPAWFLWKPVPGEWNSGSTRPDRPRHSSDHMRVLNLPVSFKAPCKFIILTFSPQPNFFCDNRISLYNSLRLAVTTNIVSLQLGAVIVSPPHPSHIPPPKHGQVRSCHCLTLTAVCFLYRHRLA